MNLSIQNNLLAMNANGQYRINAFKNVKKMEKLSSGYRINRAADDAAGLAVSEKMRRMIRGLNQGTENAQDGISWVQTGDGALNEAHDILHRMTELTVKALNGTCSDEDREFMQEEFDQLQSELDRLTNAATFNEKHIFQDHKDPYYQFEGGTVWEQDQHHVVNDGANDLTIEYRLRETDSPVSKTITVPSGVYTTQALIDEIDSALEAAGLIDEGIVFEYAMDGCCNLNLEGGEMIDDVSGGLSYLLYDGYGGGSLGALIGTTVFRTPESRLAIAEGYNDQLSFTVVNTDGSSNPVSLKIPSGSYTREELLKMLQTELDAKNPGNTVKAEEHGTGIKLSSDESIITGFKGNMFQIDTGEFAYTSVFYDNVQESTVSFTAGSFTGGAIIPVSGGKYPENQCFDICPGVNDILVLKPNGAETETVIALAPGQHSMTDMISFLNEELSPLGLQASQYSNGSFMGITIHSTHEGVASEVGIIKEKSTAYDTLFVSHDYKVQNQTATFGNETLADITATLRSGSNYVMDGQSTLPLEIQAGKNDKFRLAVNGNAYTITLDAGKYDSAAAIRDQIDKQINGSAAPAGYKGLLTVGVNSANQIYFLGNRSVTTVTVGKADGNNGYEDIFVGQKQVHQWSTSGHTAVTNNDDVIQPDGTVKIADSQKNMTVYIDGVPKSVTLPTGEHVSQADIIQAINDQLKDTKAANQFTGVRQPGEAVNRHFTVSPQRSYINYPGLPSDFNAKGESAGDPQGIAGGLVVNKPASTTVNCTLADSIAVGSANKHFECTLNGLGGSKEKKISFDLAEKTYTRAEFVSALQTQINAQCGVGPEEAGGLKVSLNSSNQLVLTAGLKFANGAEQRGDTTRILCNPATSSVLKGLYEKKNPASVNFGNSIHYPVDFGGGQTFTFQLKKPADAALKDVTVTLSGTFGNGTDLANYITTQLTNSGIPVRAGYAGSLTLTTTDGTEGYQLSFDSRKGGAAAESMFGEVPPGGGSRKLAYTTAAKASLDCNVQNSFEIDSNHNEFIMRIDGTERKATLPSGTYDMNRLVNELNQQLGAWVTVVPVGQKLHFTTKSEAGLSSVIEMTYGTGGSSMIRIFGERTVPGATADFKGGHLELTRNAPGGFVQVNSSSAGPFQLPRIETSNPESVTGRHSDKYSYIQGTPVTLNGNNKVVIDRWNKNLFLRYSTDYVNEYSDFKSKSIELDEGEYTLPELAAALETKLGSEFKVLEKDGGIRIEAANPGSRFRFRPQSYYSSQPDCSGGFYDQILCAPGWSRKSDQPVDSPGGQTIHPAFVMGRKDIKNQTTKIQRGVNDDLGMEFTVGGKTYPLKMTLDQGTYSSDALLKQVQEKLDEALDKAGLPKGLIEAGIGGFTTGVAGSNDENALHFILSDKVSLPTGSTGRCVIEGVSGTAAFSIFYQTEGDISRAYVEGTRDLTQGVDISDSNGELSIEVDGTRYTVQIPPKDTGEVYTADELINKINEQLKSDNVPLSATLENGRLHLMHVKFGQHSIAHISGSAKNTLFFTEGGGRANDSEIPIKLSSTENDKITIDRPILNTASMRINSVLISRTKYANKALQRLQAATKHVSEVRSYFGAMQNSIEYAVDNNNNKAENTTAAESRIRDTDIAKEIMEHSRLNILDQVGVVMMAQANQTPEAVLTLLR